MSTELSWGGDKRYSIAGGEPSSFRSVSVLVCPAFTVVGLSEQVVAPSELESSQLRLTVPERGEPVAVTEIFKLRVEPGVSPERSD